MASIEWLTETTGDAVGAQSDIDLDDLWIKFSFDGEMITQLTNYTTARIVVLDGGGTAPFFVEFVNDQNDFVINCHGGDGNHNIGDFATFAANFTAGQFYVFYMKVQETTANEFEFGFFEVDGTLIRDDTQENYDGPLDIGVTGNNIRIGRIDAGFASMNVWLDGLALYSQEPPDKFSEPTASDTGILAYWPIKEGSGATIGNEVAGGADLTLGGVEDTDYTWHAGGIWDAAAGGATVALPVASVVASAEELGTATTLPVASAAATAQEFVTGRTVALPTASVSAAAQGLGTVLSLPLASAAVEVQPFVLARTLPVASTAATAGGGLGVANTLPIASTTTSAIAPTPSTSGGVALPVAGVSASAVGLSVRHALPAASAAATARALGTALALPVATAGTSARPLSSAITLPVTSAAATAQTLTGVASVALPVASVAATALAPSVAAPFFQVLELDATITQPYTLTARISPQPYALGATVSTPYTLTATVTASD